MEQLRQRVRLHHHLEHLDREETANYLRHRLAVAGGAEDREIFSPACLPKLFEYTNGIPRLMNTLCDTALTAACVEDQDQVTPGLLDLAIEELNWVPYKERGVAPVKDTRPTLRVNEGVSQEQSSAMLVLRERGELLGEFALDKDSMTIGRNPDNDIRINDSSVSSYHVRLVNKGGLWHLYDLDSTNGTYVNSRLVRKCELKIGDMLTITKFQLQFSSQDKATGRFSKEAGATRIWPPGIDKKAANESSEI
jgi:hypothetical protein